MGTLTRTVAPLLLLSASWAGGSTLTFEWNQVSYVPGETAVLTIVGDPQGDQTSVGIFGRLDWSPAVELLWTTEETPTTGGVPWVSRALCQDGRLETYWTNPYVQGPYRFTDVWAFNPPNWDQPFGIDQPIIATVGLRPTQPGDYVFSWDRYFTADPGYHFFGESLGQFTTTLHVVPESSTGLLAALGLLVLGLARWMVRHAHK